MDESIPSHHGWTIFPVFQLKHIGSALLKLLFLDCLQTELAEIVLDLLVLADGLFELHCHTL